MAPLIPVSNSSNGFSDPFGNTAIVEYGVAIGRAAAVGTICALLDEVFFGDGNASVGDLIFGALTGAAGGDIGRFLGGRATARGVENAALNLIGGRGTVGAVERAIAERGINNFAAGAGASVGVVAGSQVRSQASSYQLAFQLICSVL